MELLEGSTVDVDVELDEVVLVEEEEAAEDSAVVAGPLT